MSKYTDQLLGDPHEADGIEEYDNPLPDWWLGLFWLCIAWAGAYTAWYHVIRGKDQEQRLAAEMAAAEVRWPRKAVTAAALDTSAAAIEQGKAIYLQNCVACHGAERQGGIGPSLADTTWIHGNTREAVLLVITNGVPEKGMPNWGQMIGPEKVAEVAAYVIAANGHVVP